MYSCLLFVVAWLNVSIHKLKTAISTLLVPIGNEIRGINSHSLTIFIIEKIILFSANKKILKNEFTITNIFYCHYPNGGGSI